MIKSFSGKYRFLSNFYRCLIHYNGIDFPSVEHAYQSQKTLDRDDQWRVALQPTPTAAKRWGRRVKIREDWEQVKISIMRDLLMLKFAQQEFLQQLLATGDEELIEGNDWHDQFWGDCHCLKHSGIKGRNHLGKLLMEIRQIYRDALR